ncbi:MAG: lmo0937 family membrane protein [Pyrinomonadaceae bacterium]
MLWTIILILLILWALGFSFAGVGPLIHMLLVVALVVLLIQLITGRRPAA